MLEQNSYEKLIKKTNLILKKARQIENSACIYTVLVQGHAHALRCIFVHHADELQEGEIASNTPEQTLPDNDDMDVFSSAVVSAQIHCARLELIE